MAGSRVELPEDRLTLTAKFDASSTLVARVEEAFEEMVEGVVECRRGFNGSRTPGLCVTRGRLQFRRLLVFRMLPPCSWRVYTGMGR